MIQPLLELTHDQKGKIQSIMAQGELARRLRDLGLSVGAEIKFLGYAPLKDPIRVKVRDTILSLRKFEAQSILVELNERNV